LHVYVRSLSSFSAFQDVDSDELDDQDFVPAAKRAKVSAATSRAVSSDTSGSNTGLRAIGEFMPCGECSQRFTVVSSITSFVSSAN
jgi:hypothetical protein